MGLADRRDTFPDRLSGGEQQRVAMRARWSTTRCWCWPTSRPATWTTTPAAAVLALLDGLTRRAGKKLLMVTHSPEVVGLADRVFAVQRTPAR